MTVSKKYLFAWKTALFSEPSERASSHTLVNFLSVDNAFKKLLENNHYILFAEDIF